MRRQVDATPGCVATEGGDLQTHVCHRGPTTNQRLDALQSWLTLMQLLQIPNREGEIARDQLADYVQSMRQAVKAIKS